MIADTGSNPTTEAPDLPEAEANPGALSATELYRLTLFKWRYSFEAYGFAPEQVRELMFVKWLHASGRVVP